jgi:peptide chain release factor subunit 1
MAKTSPHLDIPLRDEVEQLAAFDPQGLPVVSLYLNLTPNQHGREQYDSFVRKALPEQLKGFDDGTPERASLERDLERIDAFLTNEVTPSANGVAVFACAGAGEFFKALQVNAPIEDHELFVGAVPHLYPLVRLIDQFPRYAVVQLDTNRARIVVFALGGVEKEDRVTGVKTRRHSEGGLSQARYQRHIDNIHLHHMKEVVETLERVVRADNIHHIVLAADEPTAAMLRAELPRAVQEKVVDVIPLDRQAGDSELAVATLDALRHKDAESDHEHVADALGAWRAGGLGVAGPEATALALEMGQVEELLITATPESAEPRDRSNELVTLATQRGARVRMIEDSALLADHGGVAARLRFRI